MNAPDPESPWFERFRFSSAQFDWQTAPTTWAPKQLYGESVEEWAKSRLRNLGPKLELAQLRLFAHRRDRLLVVLQGMDTAGKDGLIRHVFANVNPVGLRVTSFGAPTEEERQHDFLWRMRRALPAPGYVAVFNRSYYEQLMYLQVHPQAADAEQAPYAALVERVLDFETELHEAQVAVVKVFLHLSPAEQARRLIKRAQTPERRWKLNASDLEDHLKWDEHAAAFARAIEATHTERAPWYVVPADNKWVARVVVAEMVLQQLQAIAPEFPTPSDEQTALCERVCSQLGGEAAD